MTDFITKMFYDQGHFDAVENDEPFFSRPIWRHLVHQTKSADDRTRILTSKSFNGASNANIIAGIYTQPDVWVEETPAQDRLINFATRQCRFAHNGAHRPVDSLRGNASVWWNILWCHAANDIGLEVRPTLRACDGDWAKKNAKVIETAFKQQRVPFMAALNARLRTSGIDVLGQGGEFIVLNQSVIDWELTRTASGFETAYRRRANAIKANLTSAFEDFRALVLKLRQGGDKMAWAHFKPVLSSKAIVLSDIIMDERTMPKFLKSVSEIAENHGFKIGLTDHPFASGTKSRADYGFVNEHGGYFFQ